MIRKIKLTYVRESAEEKLAGYFDACLAAGRVEGEFLFIPDEECARINEKFRSVGDTVHLVIKPGIGLIDRLFGTDLANCAGCKNRRKSLNKLGHKLSSAIK